MVSVVVNKADEYKNSLRFTSQAVAPPPLKFIAEPIFEGHIRNKAPMDKDITYVAEHRYTAKAYNPEKQIFPELVEKVKELIRLSPPCGSSSAGQPACRAGGPFRVIFLTSFSVLWPIASVTSVSI